LIRAIIVREPQGRAITKRSILSMVALMSSQVVVVAKTDTTER
jgi:hypothetical protein